MEDTENLNQNEELNNQDEYMDDNENENGNGKEYEDLADTNGDESGLKWIKLKIFFFLSKILK